MNNKLKFVLNLVISLFTIFLLIVVLVFFYKIKLKSNNNNDKVLGLRTIENSNCNYKPDLYYSANDYNIYSYCLDSIIVVDDYMQELKEYIIDNPNVLEKLYKNLTYVTFLDGGTKEYKDYKPLTISNNGITIIKCNGRDDKTKDVYIGPDSMYYKENFCKQDNSTFTKTFKVLGVDKGLLNEVVLTLEYFDITTDVTLNTNKDFHIGSSYEFEFMGKESNDTINSIFKDFGIVEIREINN